MSIESVVSDRERFSFVRMRNSLGIGVVERLSFERASSNPISDGEDEFRIGERIGRVGTDDGIKSLGLKCDSTVVDGGGRERSLVISDSDFGFFVVFV